MTSQNDTQPVDKLKMAGKERAKTLVSYCSRDLEITLFTGKKESKNSLVC